MTVLASCAVTVCTSNPSSARATIVLLIVYSYLFSVGPTIQFRSVHRCAASLLLAGPPTPTHCF
jgi:hypothetical protein